MRIEFADIISDLSIVNQHASQALLTEREHGLRIQAVRRIEERIKILLDRQNAERNGDLEAALENDAN
jgi:hypothetical protein